MAKLQCGLEERQMGVTAFLYFHTARATTMTTIMTGMIDVGEFASIVCALYLHLTGTHSPSEFFPFALWLISKHRKSISYALAGQEGLCSDTT
jgi:hypothetical protein